MRDFPLNQYFGLQGPNPRWPPTFEKSQQGSNSKIIFLNLVDNLILRNIKIRHFSLKQIFATLEPKIQDGRRDWRNLKMVKIKKFFLNLIFRRQILSEDSQNLRSFRRKLWCSRPEFEQYVTVKGSNLMKKGPFSFGTFSYNL